MIRDHFIDTLQDPLGAEKSPMGIALGSAALLYATGAGLHRWLSGLRGAWLPPIPTISVGSPTAGGSGKTPIAMEIAQRLLALGRLPAILTRGYGGTGPRHCPHLVQPGGREGRWGDEALMMAEALPAVRVIVDPNRRRGALCAMEAGADVLILDDGLQHFRVARHLDIAVLPADRPPEADRLIPAGRLRERPQALKRVDLLWRHGEPVAQCGSASPPLIECDLHSQLEVVAFKNLKTHRSMPASALSQQQIGLWTAIARPQRVTRTLKRLGAHVAFAEHAADHAWPTAAAVARAAAKAQRCGAVALLVTSKDAVKIPTGEAYALPIHVIETQLIILKGSQLLQEHLRQALQAAPTRRAETTL